MRELFREFAAARAQADDAYDGRVAQAWLTASLVRAKKVPALKTLLSRRRNQERQTVGQMRTTLHMLSEQYGIAPPRKAAPRVQ